jgi:hypothetical protein
MKRPKDLADRSRELRDVCGLGSDGSLRETFTLPLLAARQMCISASFSSVVVRNLNV